MSWSDDTRCLHCDGKLPLYRKITSGQFCSAAHRRDYWKEQERLAVERLSQTHDSLRAYRPPDAEAILGVPATGPLPPLSSAPSRVPNNSRFANSPNPFYLDGQRFPEEDVLDFARTASNRDEVVLAGFVRNAPLLALDWYCSPLWIAPGPMGFTACAPEIPVSSGVTPVSQLGFFEDVPMAETIGLASSITPAALEVTHRPAQPLTPASALISRAIELGIVPETPALLLTAPVEVDVQPAEIEIPFEAPVMSENVTVSVTSAAPEPVFTEPIFAEAVSPGPVSDKSVSSNPGFAEPALLAGPVALPKPEMLASATAPAAWIGEWMESAPALAMPPALTGETLAPSMAPAVPLTSRIEPKRNSQAMSAAETGPLESDLTAPLLMCLETTPAARTLGSAKMVALVAPRTSASASAPAHSAVQAVDLAVAHAASRNLPPSGLELPDVARQMPLAGMVRFPLHGGSTIPAKTEVVPAQTLVRTVDIPELPLHCISSMEEPAAAWLQKLPFKPAPVALEAAQAFAANPAPLFPTDAEPKLPRHRFEPMDGTAVPPPPRSFLAFSNWLPGDPSERRNPWEHVGDFWAHAPRDLKLLVFAIPVLLGLALHPRLPKVHVTAPGGTASVGISKNFQQVFLQQVSAVQQNVASRAGVALAEDFRSGLEDWQTHGDLSTAWSFDANGFARPGSLALYRPSMRLSDYDLQFLGLIDKKALSFVARAQDFENYYVIKLVVLKAGPLPTIGVTRYAVINGKAQNRVDSVAPINTLPDTLYHVDLNVHDDTYLLSLQGKVVDNWSEPRLAHGGVGFFAQKGEESRVRWVQLTHQYDMLGRLCAYLAPYNISNTNGSF
jgi:hypothetical protein